MSDQQHVRLNVNLNTETADALKKLSKANGISLTEAVRRAISLYDFVADERAQGHVLQTVDPDRGLVRDLILL